MSEAAVVYPTPAAPAVARQTVVLRRLVRDPLAVVALVFLAVMVAAVVGAPWITRYDPTRVDFAHPLGPASLRHPLGTDALGRDELSRILFGGRLSLTLAVAASGGISILGLALGLLSGLYGRWLDAVVMRVVDVLQALPMFLLALVVVGIFGQGLHKIVLTMALVGWPGYARVVRGMALSLRERQFLEASQALGASRLRLAVRHMAPNLLGPVVVLSTLDVGRVLLGVSALSFLGFAAVAPHPEWGAMVADARTHFQLAPRLVFYPGLAITLMVLAFNLAGDSLRDLLDPRITRSHR